MHEPVEAFRPCSDVSSSASEEWNLLELSVPNDPKESESSSTPNPSMALPVTRHAHFTEVGEWEFLACGWDSVDLGVSVEWGPGWGQQCEVLETEKKLASGTQGSLSKCGRFLHRPSGKANYPWHLEWPEFHLYLSKEVSPQHNTPNVYVSIGSRTLWELSLDGAVARLTEEIERLGGTITDLKPSRVDWAADFWIPSNLSVEFVRTQRVPCHTKYQLYLTGTDLETFYQGCSKAPIRLRIYDKGLEVSKGGTKLWFLDVWKKTTLEHIWRVEFQARRPVLKQFQIQTLGDLKAKASGMWDYFTTSWFSLRRPDDRNTTRRTIHPWWKAVADCAGQFGESTTVRRQFTAEVADSAWYVSHIAGCLPSFAAREGLDDLEEAFALLIARVKGYWRNHDFAKKLAEKAIALGNPAKALLPQEETAN